MTDRLVYYHHPLAVSLLLLLALLTILPAAVIGSELTILYSNDIRGEIEPCG